MMKFPWILLVLVIETSQTTIPDGDLEDLFSDAIDTTTIIRTQENLTLIPNGTAAVRTLDLGYNLITTLPDSIFASSNYKNLEKLILIQNRISEIGRTAFRDLRKLKTIDLSDNRISSLDPYLFNTNKRLERLVLVNNQITFKRVQVFLNSYSLESLVLSGNNVTEIYPITCIGLPSLKRLTLSHNPLRVIREDSFRMNVRLQFLSVAFTQVEVLTRGMFHSPPAILNVEETNIARRFEPQLTQLRGESVLKLLQTQHHFVNGD